MQGGERVNKNEKNLTILAITVACVGGLAVGTVYGMDHIDYEDEDWECKKWVGIVELAKQHYPNFVDDTLMMAEKKCGFDVNEITS